MRTGNARAGQSLAGRPRRAVTGHHYEEADGRTMIVLNLECSHVKRRKKANTLVPTSAYCMQCPRDLTTAGMDLSPAKGFIAITRAHAVELGHAILDFGTEVAAAKASGVSRSSIQSILDSTSALRVQARTLDRIAAAHGVSREGLLRGDWRGKVAAE